ncbi:MAG: MFS transporter, partial [Sphingomonadales bacterium]
GSAVPGGALIGLPAFLVQPLAWRLTADFFGLAVVGGIYVVPLYAFLQNRAEPARRARTIAALNVMNAFFMVLSAIVGMIAYSLGASVAGLMAGAGVASLLPALYLWRRLPRDVTDPAGGDPAG